MTFPAMRDVDGTMQRHTRRRLLARVCGWAAVLVLSSTGCGTLPNGRGWGQDATLRPGWQRIITSAVRAAKDPLVWVPLAGAAVLQIDDADESISDWAVDNTPIFGSVDSAKDARGYFGTLSEAALAITLLATPSGDEAPDWVTAKLKGGAFEYGARLLMYETVDVFKELSGRTRPDKSNDKSFPSEHAARVSFNSTLASRNTRSLQIPEQGRVALNVGYATLSALAAWSRVEAEGHYPSDVLVGAAWGRFLASFVYDAFLGVDHEPFLFNVYPIEGGGAVSLTFSF